MKLSAEQEKTIQQYVDSHELKLKTLRDDIIDHLCCVVESGLGKGKPFEQLLNEAVDDIAPNGLREIDRRTTFLINYNRILIMKKIMYVIGFIGSVALTMGVAFKLLHLPGANPLFMIGYLSLLLIFVPLLAFDRFKVAIAKVLSVRLKIIFGAISSVILGLAGLFKILHLQGADVLLMLGTIIFAVGFLPFLFFTMYRSSVS